MSWGTMLRQRVSDFVTASCGKDWPGRAEQAKRLAAAIERADQAETPAARGAAALPAGATGHVDKSGLPFAPPSGGPSKHARRLDRRPKILSLRIRVLNRARAWFGNRCEFCRAGKPEELHHVLKGADRVSEEDETTGAAVCEECHRKTEASPDWARRKGHGWALMLAEAARRRGFPELAAGFDRTAQILEGKIALAEAQARPLPTERA